MLKHGYEHHRFLVSPYLVRDSGIYAIINRSNNKIYVGSAVSVNKRLNVHRTELWQNRHGNRYLQRAYKKDPSQLQVEILEVLTGATKELLIGREQFWINFFKSYLPEHGYNLCPKADSCQGIKRDFGYGVAVSRRMTGYKHTAEARANMSRGQTGVTRKKWSEEARKRHSVIHTGYKHTDEQRRKISEHHKKHAIWSRPVNQVSLDGRFIKRFDRIKYAEDELNKGRPSNIWKVCNGQRAKSLGFIWEYAN